jgi:hypothetical protein
MYKRRAYNSQIYNKLDPTWYELRLERMKEGTKEFIMSKQQVTQQKTTSKGT